MFQYIIMVQVSKVINTIIGILVITAIYILVKVLMRQNLTALALSSTNSAFIAFAYAAVITLMILTLVLVIIARYIPKSRLIAGTLIIIFLLFALLFAVLAGSIMSIISIIIGLIVVIIAYAETKDIYLSSLFGAFSYGLFFIIFLIIALVIYSRNKDKDRKKLISKIELLLIIQIVLTLLALMVLFIILSGNPIGILKV